MAHSDASIGTVDANGEQEITFEVLASLFHLPLSMAAQQLGVCCTALKKKCRKNGISRWPYRTLQSIDKMIKAIETSPQNERASIELEYLQSKRDVIMRKPSFSAKGSSARPNLNVKKTIIKPSQKTRVVRSGPSNPLDLLQEAANYADSTGHRRLVPAISPPPAEPRLHYNPQPYRVQTAGYESVNFSGSHQVPAVGSYTTGHPLAPTAQFSMVQSVSARMPQSIQPAPRVPVYPQQQMTHQMSHQMSHQISHQMSLPMTRPQSQPQQTKRPLSYTFHASSPPYKREQSLPVSYQSTERTPQPTKSSGSTPNWSFELPKLRISDDSETERRTLPKLRTLEPSAFSSLRPAVESTIA